MQSLAEQFYSTYNGCRYNSLEKTVCQLVYVSRLEILKSSQGAALASPGLTELPSCPVCLERLVCGEKVGGGVGGRRREEEGGGGKVNGRGKEGTGERKAVGGEEQRCEMERE